MKIILRSMLVWLCLLPGVQSVHALPGQTATPDEKVADAIRDYVAGRLSVATSEMKIELRTRIAGIRMTGKETLEIKEARQSDLLGLTVFLLTVKDQRGKTLSVQWVTADVKMGIPVVVAKHLLERHRRIEAGDLEIQTVYVTRPADNLTSETDAFIGKRTVRSFRQGAPLIAAQVEEIPVIKRGERVTLVFESDVMRITTLGQAKEDGFYGRQMAVLNVDSKKIVYGTVIDSGNVRVEPN